MLRSKAWIINLLESHVIGLLDFEFVQGILRSIRLCTFNFLVQYILIKETLVFFGNRGLFHVRKSLFIEVNLTRFDILVKANIVDLYLGKTWLLGPLYVLIKGLVFIVNKHLIPHSFEVLEEDVYSEDFRTTLTCVHPELQLLLLGEVVISGNPDVLLYLLLPLE